MRYTMLALLIILPGATGIAIFSHFALIDWNALQETYQSYEAIAQSSSDLPTLFKAEAQQNIHRINLFAEGVWALLSAILVAIGIHGVFTSI
ncbi:hypothetical protein HC928_13620 [bacterium]|nr:hypothetical protein [bacterium]